MTSLSASDREPCHRGRAGRTTDMRGASRPPRTVAARNGFHSNNLRSASDHQLRINRRPSDLTVEGSQLLAQISQHLRHHGIDPAQQMARRNAFFEIEQIKQLALIDRLPTHHGKPPPPVASTRRNHCSPFIASPFSTVSVKMRNT